MDLIGNNILNRIDQKCEVIIPTDTRMLSVLIVFQFSVEFQEERKGRRFRRQCLRLSWTPGQHIGSSRTVHPSNQRTQRDTQSKMGWKFHVVSIAWVLSITYLCIFFLDIGDFYGIFVIFFFSDIDDVTNDILHLDIW